VRALLLQGVDVNARDALGRTALIAAAGEPNESMLHLLIDRGADLTLRDHDGMDALASAIFRGRKDNMRLLLDAGANPEARNPAGETALMMAIRADQVGIVDDLLQRGADPNVYTQDEIMARDGFTPLMYVAKFGSGDDGLHMLHSLVAHRALPGIQRPNGETALTIAQRSGRRQIAEELSKLGTRDESVYAGMSAGDALIKAIRLDDVAKVRELLDSGVASNFRDVVTGITPLAAAAFYGRQKAVELLIRHGADVGDVPWGLKEDRIAVSDVPVAQRDLLEAVARGDTALISAVRRNDVGMVALLLEHGARVEQPNRSGDTPALLAVRSGETAVVRQLLQHGLDPNVTSFPPRINYLLTRLAKGEGLPPLLIEAVQTGHAEVVKVLLEAGANPDIQDGQGRTALYWAAAANQMDMVRLLVAHRADRDIRDRFGATALDIARMNGHQQTAALIATGAD
jgi:ankyrin repeat protein